MPGRDLAVHWSIHLLCVCVVLCIIITSQSILAGLLTSEHSSVTQNGRHEGQK